MELLWKIIHLIKSCNDSGGSRINSPFSTTARPQQRFPEINLLHVIKSAMKNVCVCPSSLICMSAACCDVSCASFSALCAAWLPLLTAADCERL